ncbi:hypothetical protein ACA910_000376 [Epithemia clementina (nom. ined.)]
MRPYQLQALLLLAAICEETLAATGTPSSARAQKQKLVNWLRSNDGYFSDKLSFEPPSSHPLKDYDAGGIFALQPIEKGETIMFIPRNCLFRPPRDSRTRSMCDTAKRLVDEYQEGEDESDHWPYIEYVFESFPHDHLPSAWSRRAKFVVRNIVGQDLLYPRAFGSFDPCEQFHSDDDEYNQLLDAALRIVESRGWNEMLVPVFDMGNHRNGHWHNMDQLHDSKTHKDFEVVALRNVEAGEQLYLSYNECPDHTCDGEAHKFITPNFFSAYGFVEEYPQRWEFATGPEENDYILFELDLPSTNKAKVHYTEKRISAQKLQLTWLHEDSQKPDSEQLEWLQVQLKRLQGMKDYVSFEVKHLEAHEETAILSYFNALQQAVEQAILAGVKHLQGQSKHGENGGNEYAHISPASQNIVSFSGALVWLPIVVASIFALIRYSRLLTSQRERKHHEI